MLLPSKVTRYKDSILPKLPIVLTVLMNRDLTPLDLYKETKKKFKNVSEFIETLDCLFALGKVDFVSEEVLHYADHD